MVEDPAIEDPATEDAVMDDMEDAGTDGRAGHWAARSWRAVRLVSARTSLRTKLVATVLVLVVMALAAMGFSGISLLRGQLLGTYANSLQQEANSGAIPGCLFSGRCPSGLAVYFLDSSGHLQVVSYGANAYSPEGTSQPSLSGKTASWLADNPQQAVTISAASGSGPWLAMAFPFTGGTLNGGTVILAVDVSGVYTTIRQLTDVDLIVSGAILLVLAVVGFAVVQTNLRPLVEIEETAGEIAAGHLNRRVPERDPRTEIGRLGRSLNTMLSQIETAFHAREKSEAAAHQSEERMRRFIADASHELRTPLTAIRGFAEYYRQRGGLVRYYDEPGLSGNAGGLTPEDLDRIMQRVEAEAARMGVLVEDLLTLARLDQQRPLARQPVDLLSLAGDAVYDARLLAPSRAIDLSVQPGAAFLVIGDEPRLRQIIGNLMSNALGHTPDGTPIGVSISSGTLDPRKSTSVPAVILDVTDHGPGMTPEQAHRAFERFYRADQARTRKAGGSGLGLAIVAALVAAHGGVASVRTTPGQGATFRIALPLAPEAHGGDDADQLDPADEDFVDETVVAEEADLADGDDGASRSSVDEIRFGALAGQRGAGRGTDLFPVGRAEQAGVHEQRVQLMQRHPGPPAGGQRPGVLIADQDPVQVGRAEQGQHGQVRLAVAAVCRRIDEPAPAAGPQHVPCPAVAVDAARRLGRAGQRVDTVHHRLYRPRVFRPQRARVDGGPEVGHQPAGGVPLRPWLHVRARQGVVQRQAGDEARPGRAEAVRTRLVQPGQVGAELEGGLRGRLAGPDHRDDEGSLGDGQHARNRDGLGLRKPAQAVRLGRERHRMVRCPRRACRHVRGARRLVRRDQEGLGEGALAAGEGEHEVLVAMLRPDHPRIADAQPGQPGDPACGRTHRPAPGGSRSRPSRSTMTGAAADTRARTWS